MFVNGYFLYLLLGKSHFKDLCYLEAKHFFFLVNGMQFFYYYIIEEERRFHDLLFW